MKKTFLEKHPVVKYFGPIVAGFILVVLTGQLINEGTWRVVGVFASIGAAIFFYTQMENWFGLSTTQRLIIDSLEERDINESDIDVIFADVKDFEKSFAELRKRGVIKRKYSKENKIFYTLAKE